MNSIFHFFILSYHIISYCIILYHVTSFILWYHIISYYLFLVAVAPKKKCYQADRFRILLSLHQANVHLHTKQILPFTRDFVRWSIFWILLLYLFFWIDHIVFLPSIIWLFVFVFVYYCTIALFLAIPTTCEVYSILLWYCFYLLHSLFLIHDPCTVLHCRPPVWSENWYVVLGMCAR